MKTFEQEFDLFAHMLRLSVPKNERDLCLYTRVAFYAGALTMIDAVTAANLDDLQSTAKRADNYRDEVTGFFVALLGTIGVDPTAPLH